MSYPELRFATRLNDPIHGLQGYTAEERAIFDHALFQRLRNITQTGFCRLHASGAEHSRFGHALGVVTVSAQMVHALIENSLYGSAKLAAWLDRHNPEYNGAGVCVHEMDDTLKYWLLRFVRYAALVHDLGHGPFSHIFEDFLPTFAQAEAVLKDEKLAGIKPLIDAWRERHPQAARITHEIVSCILFVMIWRDVMQDLKLEASEVTTPVVVACMLLGLAETPCALTLGLDPAQLELLPLMSELISSPLVDADRCDYLLRDGYAMGTRLGAFDLHRIFKGLLAVSTDGQLHVGWKRSALHDLQQFIHGRASMFARMYGHKTNHAASLMLGEVNRAFKSGQLPSPLSTRTLSDFVRDYLGLTDERFLGLVSGDYPAYLQPSDETAQLGRNLRARRLWRRIYDEADQDFDPTTMDERLTALVEHLRKAFPGVRFVVAKHQVRATKGLQTGARLATVRVHQDRELYRIDPTRSWLDISSVMRALSEEEAQRRRVFVSLPPGGTSRPFKIEALKFMQSQYPQHHLAPVT